MEGNGACEDKGCEMVLRGLVKWHGVCDGGGNGVVNVRFKGR